MRSRCLSIAACLALLALPSFAAPPDARADLQAVLSRMDKAAGDFKAMTAQVTYVTHTDVLNEDNTETGTAIMQKVQPGEVGGLVDFVSPDPHSVTFEKRHVQRYFPKIKTLEVYDLEKNGEQLDKFLMIGFGTSGAELARDYEMALLGMETPKGQTGRFIHLRLSPKSPEGRQYVKTLELWVPEQDAPYPVQERILQPSGDYVVVTYSDLKINPMLKADALQLKLPAGVKTVYPGR
jgi:outer membrane lipoprotein-sorting protein